MRSRVCWASGRAARCGVAGGRLSTRMSMAVGSTACTQVRRQSNQPSRIVATLAVDDPQIVLLQIWV
jgi:hypothetical protein